MKIYKILFFHFLSFLFALLFFVELSFFLGRGVLVLLVLAHQIVHVALRFGELHLVHTFSRVPMQESLPPEHSSELLRNALKELLDCSAVANEGSRHLQASGRNITNSS